MNKIIEDMHRIPKEIAKKGRQNSGEQIKLLQEIADEVKRKNNSQ